MNSLPGEFLHALGYTLLEYRGEGKFTLLTDAPEWFVALWGKAGSPGEVIPLAEKSPFLENFLFEAENCWSSQAGQTCSSETWIEKSPSGQEIPVQAMAVVLNGRGVLALHTPAAEFRERVSNLQVARTALLDHEKLIREIQKKEILLHCIVHDLSQPLSVMHVAMDCLTGEKVSDRGREFLQLGQLASNQQESMIREILHTFAADLRSTLDAGMDDNASPDLLQCAQTAMNSLSSTYRAKGVRLALIPAAEPYANWAVRGEESRLLRIFSNLLENALRYTPAGAEVRVNVEDEGDFRKAYIDDEGPGLPNDLRPEQIFGLFGKGKQSGGKAGLGLYFCRITVERWGGSIGCVSLPEKGSRFWFRLPKGAAKSAEPLPAANSEITQKVAGVPGNPVLPRALHILLADDQDDIRTLTTYQLERNGHQVTTAKTGTEALLKLRSERFDVAMLDEEMPGKTGDQVARAIRAEKTGPNAHAMLIALTGNNTEDDKRRLLETGFNSVLGKPFRMELLNQLLLGSESAESAVLPDEAGAQEHVRRSPTGQSSPSMDLLERVGGDKKLLQKMIKTFLRDAPLRLASLGKALKNKNSGELASQAHALRGSVSIFGALRARQYCQDLQDFGKEGNLTAAGPLLESLKEEIAKLEENLRGYGQPSGAQSSLKVASNAAKHAKPVRKTR
jgi:signal transduction histidine kinase/HPt (histidine-containing phosphotransfer) domain-containing protein/ActR/RegA family two-component response regulator